MTTHARPRGLLRFAPAPWLALPALLAGCASAPLPVPQTSMEQKLAWILRLEDQRVLRDPAPPAPPPSTAARGRRAAPAPATPDLVVLLSDDLARVRRSAALAVGRVGLGEGMEPLMRVLGGDPDPAVRQAAAFGLGLLRDAAAADALRRALGDPDALVQGRAAEALSLLDYGTASSAQAAADIGTMVARQLEASGAARLEPDAVSEEPGPEAFRLGVVALGRLKAFEPLAAAVLDAAGRPRVRWWPVAFALQRCEDRRAVPALLAFARDGGSFGRSFAARALGTLKEVSAAPLLIEMAEGWRADSRAAVSAIRALGGLGDPRASAALARLVEGRDVDPLVLLEATTAAGAARAREALDRVQDLTGHPLPFVRAAALRALREIDEESFTLVLSGLDADRHWSVRAATASVLATLDQERAAPRLSAMLADADARVIPAVLDAMARLRVPGVEAQLLERLRHDDIVVRMTAAAKLGELKPAGGEARLAESYRAWLRDDSYVARAAALGALAKYGAAAARPVLEEALADRDWAVRVKAADLLRELDPSSGAAPARPAPSARPPAAYESPDLLSPPFSPQVYLETGRGTVQLELLVVDAPLTCDNFMALARRGFFDGAAVHRVVPNFVVQDGDPRGDGEGGPGFTIRDELNERAYGRGTVGMALDWADTGGSQFFITHSPQPHLEARYTVFGRVVAGMEVVDRLQPWDTITRVRVWDGKTIE
jgi:cyclophilin family peptidyl-prolyl cis-trans isomerase/HEAT repeat protein